MEVGSEVVRVALVVIVVVVEVVDVTVAMTVVDVIVGRSVMNVEEVHGSYDRGREGVYLLITRRVN